MPAAADAGARPVGLRARALEAVFGDVDARRLGMFRRAIAATFGAYMIERLTSHAEWLTDVGYHHAPGVQPCYEPDALPTLPPWGVPIFAVLALGSSGALVLGRAPRAAAGVALACAIYAQSVDRAAAFSLNALYVMIFALLAVAPRPEPATDGGPPTIRAWPVRCLQASLVVQYFTAGTCKILWGDWLEVPDVLWTQIQGAYRTPLAAWLLQTVPRPVFGVLELTTLAFELLAPVIWLHRRLVPFAIVTGVVFHAFIALTMENLIFFSQQLCCYYLLFVDPEGARRVLEKLRARLGPRGLSRPS